jgi:rSAM/selenodomain-associated transferase 1
MSVAVAIMTKTPGYSPVKTRLATSLGAPVAIEMHRHSARATASVVERAARRDDVCAYWAIAESTPAAAAAWPAVEVADFELIHQSGDDLGERMARLHSDLVARHGAAILVGTDSPQMESWHLTRAIDWLLAEAPRLVLGLADDGGFWLFGGNRSIPLEDWHRVPYSTQQTGATFAAMIAPYGELLSLPRLADVDVIADLERLQMSLRHLPQPTGPQQALLRWLEERAG